MQAVDDTTGEAGEIPEGWVETEDPSSGQVYYYNSTTGEVSWEMPQPEVSQSEVPEDIEPDPLNSDEDEQADSLPEGWVVFEDPSSGRKYFYNSISGEVSWEGPTEEKQEAPTSSEQQAEPETDEGSSSRSSSNVMRAAVSGSAVEDEEESESESEEDEITEEKANESELLPEGWEAVPDSSSGQTYYYNHLTGETSWEKPVTNNSTAGGRNH